jgi:rhamnulose-1-phosphate aldolase
MNQPTLDSTLAQMADTGVRLAAIDAAEGAAGNISVFSAAELEPPPAFRRRAPIELPVAVPHLASGWIVVTGAGRRLRDVGTAPERSVCLLHIQPGGIEAVPYAAEGVRPTSELNTHLAVHNDHVRRRGLHYHGVVHAQPLRLTYLSHIPGYQETAALNRRLLRWQPETIVEFPEGIAILPFQMPGSEEQMSITTEALARYRGVIWARHGIVTRADSGPAKAGDLVEYAEAAAQYEYLNLVAGEPSTGLSDDEIRLICDRLHIEQQYF